MTIQFFQKIVVPLVKGDYSSVNVVKYSEKKKSIVIKLLRGINSRSDSYLFITDINSSPCVTNKKDEKRRIFNSLLDSDNIVVVIQEIESWYYAGLESEKCSELNVSVLSSTDSMKKEDFNRLIPQEHTHLTFMLEILDIYSLDIAAQKNNSVNYFLNKHVYQHNGSSS